jgi:hypothetical protein
LLRRPVGVTNNEGVGENRNGAVAWIERVHVASGSRRVVRKRDNMGVMGDRFIVRRLGCIMKREGTRGLYICEQTSAVFGCLVVWQRVE